MILVSFFDLTTHSAASARFTDMKCRSGRINETTCKHLWFFDRPQTVQCVSGESLSSRDFETLGEYCTKDNRTCDVPCEYAKRERMVGSVHDDKQM